MFDVLALVMRLLVPDTEGLAHAAVDNPLTYTLHFTSSIAAGDNKIETTTRFANHKLHRQHTFTLFTSEGLQRTEDRRHGELGFGLLHLG